MANSSKITTASVVQSYLSWLTRLLMRNSAKNYNFSPIDSTMDIRVSIAAQMSLMPRFLKSDCSARKQLYLFGSRKFCRAIPERQ